MIAARVAGVPRPGLLHGVGEFFLVERLAGGLHGGQQRRFGKRLGARVFFLSTSASSDVLRLALAQTRRQRLPLRRRLRLPRSSAFLAFAGADIEHLPADLLHGAAGRVIAVHDLPRCGSR